MKISDTAVLEVLHEAHAEGQVAEGNYKEVWTQVAEVLGASVPFSHWRATQLARVGRTFELHTGLPFTTVCPDLPEFASDWTSALA